MTTTELKIRVYGLPESEVSMGVPLTDKNELLLGPTGKKPDISTRIKVARVDDNLSIVREDGKPIQISYLYEKYPAQYLGIDMPAVTALRSVLLSPVKEIELRQIEENIWFTEQIFRDSEHGPHDFEKFMRKIASVSLKKTRKAAVS